MTGRVMRMRTWVPAFHWPDARMLCTRCSPMPKRNGRSQEKACIVRNSSPIVTGGPASTLFDVEVRWQDRYSRALIVSMSDSHWISERSHTKGNSVNETDRRINSNALNQV